MARNTGIFNIGSVLPSILDKEKELLELESKELENTEKQAQDAKRAGEKLIEETMKKLPNIEEKEKKKLLEEVDAKVEELNISEERTLRSLEQHMKHNRKSVLDFILTSIIPRWDGQYPE